MTNIMVNGDFENGVPWQVEYGSIELKVRRKITWGETAGQVPAVIVGKGALLPRQGQSIPPFQGKKMFRINGLEGGKHVTRAETSVRIPPSFGSSCSYFSMK